MLARSIALDLWTLAKPALAIVALLVILRLLVLREPLANGWMLLAAVLLTIVGLYLFLTGAAFGLIPLCESTGRSLVGLNHKLPIVLFACAVGYLSTLLEPGLRTVARQVEEVSVGAIRQPMLIHTAALGFALGAGLGVVRILFPFSMKIAAAVSLVLLLVRQSQLRAIVGAITSAGRLTEPGIGILFTVPVGLIVGLEYLETGGVGT